MFRTVFPFHRQESNTVHTASGLFINKLNIMLFRDGINQILVGISSSPVVVLVQFNGKWLISVVGSKTENGFLIIFSLFY